MPVATFSDPILFGGDRDAAVDIANDGLDRRLGDDASEGVAEKTKGTGKEIAMNAQGTVLLKWVVFI